MATASNKLRHSFFQRPAIELAPDLLGKILVHRVRGREYRARIVETEAYVGEHDLACHASKGRTQRTEVMFGPGGHAYVYFIYGMYWCFNAVTRAEGEPSAVLVRALEPLAGIDLMRSRRGMRSHRDADLTNGPGKLCQALGVTGHHNRYPLDVPPLVIRAGSDVPREAVIVTPRVGISRSAEWPLRWFVAGSPFVSKTPSHFPRLPAHR